jgi:hypothetical protein
MSGNNKSKQTFSGQEAAGHVGGIYAALEPLVHAQPGDARKPILVVALGQGALVGGVAVFTLNSLFLDTETRAKHSQP